MIREIATPEMADQAVEKIGAEVALAFEAPKGVVRA